MRYSHRCCDDGIRFDLLGSLEYWSVWIILKKGAWKCHYCWYNHRVRQNSIVFRYWLRESCLRFISKKILPSSYNWTNVHQVLDWSSKVFLSFVFSSIILFFYRSDDYQSIIHRKLLLKTKHRFCSYSELWDRFLGPDNYKFHNLSYWLAYS